ncbi:MAG TPA: CAP domain-containing protein [Devosia sp.]|nr:CAP domain-containing protein [Devosia sp.]
MTLSLSRRGFITLGAVSLLSACSPSMGPVTTTTTPPRLTTAGIIAAINGVRAANGRKPLAYNNRLEDAARRQARLMADRDQLSHNLGKSLRQRVTDVGYDGAVGENVAAGQRSLEAAIESWLNSSGHRNTLLSDRFTEFGLAVASVPSGRKSRYGIYWAFIAGGDSAAWIR